MGIVQCSYNVSMGYGLKFFYFLYNSELYKIVVAMATLRNRTILYSLRMETARKWEFRHHTGAVRSSQAKCKLHMSK